jgi:prepilin-type N-terminal cleavage/methylation domain-containing protein
VWNLKLLKIRKKSNPGNENGFTLVEVVIAIMLLGIVVAGLFTGLASASKVLLHTDSRETAKNLAETQLELVKGQIFVPGSGSAVYTPAATPTGFTVTINVIDGANNTVFGPNLTQTRDGNLQKIIVTVTGPGVVYNLEGYKVR